MVLMDFRFWRREPFFLVPKPLLGNLLGCKARLCKKRLAPPYKVAQAELGPKMAFPSRSLGTSAKKP